MLYKIINNNSVSTGLILLTPTVYMPIYAVWWFKLVTNIVLNWYADLSQNAPIKCCFRNIKYFIYKICSQNARKLM